MTDSGSFKNLDLNDFHEFAERYKPFFRNRPLGKPLSMHDAKWKFIKKEEKKAIHFLSMETPADLSLLVQITPVVLKRLINEPDYREVFIPKKRGGKRTRKYYGGQSTPVLSNNDPLISALEIRRDQVLKANNLESSGDTQIQYNWIKGIYDDVIAFIQTTK
jgi:hypothetical protein